MKTYLLFPPTEEDLRLPPRGMHWTVVQKYLTECSQRLIQTVDRSETDMELSLETWGVRLYCSSQKCLEAYRQLPLHSEEQLTLAYLVRNILNKRYSETGIEPERIPVRGEEGGKMGAEGIVFIEGGEYVRPERYYTSAGGLEEQRVDWYRVRVSSFYIDKFKVTNKAYCRFLNDGNPGYWNWTHKAIRREPDGRFVVDPDKANLPVSDVNWYQAVGYAEWVGKRLPTEAEWEYAAGGKEGRKYPWGNEEPDAARANAGFLGGKCSTHR